MRRVSEAAKRAAERRLREDAARRLREEVPKLESLTLSVDERRDGEDDSDVSHIRHIVVAHAPAMFELPCCDRHCDGGHDFTGRILRGLKAREREFEGQHRCGGNSKEGDCVLEMRFVASATYAE